MPTEKSVLHRLIENTALAYKSYQDITSDDPNLVAGYNTLSTSKNTLTRRPGFSDKIETNLTTFTSASREFKWSKWGGARFFSMVNDITATASIVYKLEVGIDASYSLLFSSTSTSPFDFVVSNNTLYYGNGTDMRAWSGGATDRKWGIVRPSSIATVGTSGTGTSTYAGGWYYRYTYCNSSSGHESSASDLSACTGNFSNKQVDVSVTASTDTQVDQIRIYRTTDGGSTNSVQMREISGSPFSNTTTSHADTTADGSLGTRTCPGTTTNDPPTPCSKLVASLGRIWGATNATTYFSGLEELNGYSVNEESWPSGVTGNFYPWNAEVTSQRPVPNGIAVFHRGQIWAIEGSRRDNFIRYKLLDYRGAVSHNATTSLGNDVAWLDTSGQVWLSSLGEIGYDIRTDLSGIDHSKAYLVPYIFGNRHWLLLLDGANGNLWCYDLDTNKWQTKWILTSGTTCLSSGETSSGTVALSCALSGTQMYSMNQSRFVDAGSSYTASLTVNLLKLHAQGNPEWVGVLDYVGVETDGHTNSDVLVMFDDDPASGTYTSVFAYSRDPLRRQQGINLVKKIYSCNPFTGSYSRCSLKLDWSASDSDFTLYTLDYAYHPHV